MTQYFKEFRPHSILNVNAKNTGSFTIDTTENGTESFHPLLIVFVLNTASAVSVVPTISVGTNSSTYNNIMPAALLTGLTSAGMILPMPITSAISKVAANTAIKGNVTIGATATTATIDIHVFGYYN